jgi:hypothetical protein
MPLANQKQGVPVKSGNMALAGGARYTAKRPVWTHPNRSNAWTMKQLVIACGAFLLTLFLPALFLPPAAAGTPYLSFRNPDLLSPSTYMAPYHAILHRILRSDTSGEESVPVYVWQDHRGNNRQQHQYQSAPPPESHASPYQTLGVEENATSTEIAAAYRKKMMEYHPDRVAHLSGELQEIAQKKSTEINRAYEMLLSKR